MKYTERDMGNVTTVIITGRPGSGKGTQAKRLADERGWLHFSTGDKFKALREEASPLGAAVKEAYDAGKLLPDWFATYLFQEAILNLPPDKGVILDGYPRSRAQAETFNEIASWLARPYLAIDLTVPEDEVVKRMLLRAEDEHRPDSATEEQVRARLHTYDEHTAPVLGYFRDKGLLKELDGTGTMDEVAVRITEALG